jgi:hypothetical protein
LQRVTTRVTKSTVCIRGTTEQREPKQGGTNDRESEHLDSTEESGELVFDEDPPEGSEMPYQTTDAENYVECPLTWITVT